MSARGISDVSVQIGAAIKRGDRFRCILADPPWTYRAFSTAGLGRAPQRHYATMTTAEIAALRVREIALPKCWLFLWTSGPHLFKAIEIMRAWGFEYSSIAFTWAKLKKSAPPRIWDARSFWQGLGHTTRKNTELCLLGRRGKPGRLSREVFELIIAPRREHSRKPDQQYQRIETYCAGPRVELFSRVAWPGWTAWGNEVGTFKAPARAYARG